MFDFLQLIMSKAAKLFCLQYDIGQCCQTRKCRRDSTMSHRMDAFNALERDGTVEHHETLITRDYTDSINGSRLDGVGMLDRRLRNLHQMLGEVIRKQTEKEKKEKVCEDIALQWRNLAILLDRFFFMVYVVVITVSLVILFPR